MLELGRWPASPATCGDRVVALAKTDDRILVARHGGVEPSVAGLWKTETDRRVSEIESGKV